MTFGLGRKAGGLINAIGSYPVDRAAEAMGYKNTPSFWDRYHEIVDPTMEAINEYHEDNPVEAAGLELGAGVFNPANKVGVGFIKNGTSFANTALRSGVVGSGIGGVAGTMNAEQVEDVVPNAFGGSLSGAAIGGALPLATNGAKAGYNVFKKINEQIPSAKNKIYYDNFINQNADKEVMDFMPRKAIKNSVWYQNVTPDNTPVEMTNIDESLIPNFQSKAELRNWLKNTFSTVDKVVIDSTGENVNFSNAGAARIIKNSRNRLNNIAYPQIDEIVKLGNNSGIRPADAKHLSSVLGQNIYHSGIMYKGSPFSVEYYIDQPLNTGGLHNFAGNKIKKVARDTGLTPLTNGSNLPQQPSSSYNLADLRGKINDNIPNISSLYDGLTPTETHLLDQAIAKGLGNTNRKAGTLESVNEIKKALENMINDSRRTNIINRLTFINNPQTTSLRKIKTRFDDVLKSEIKAKYSEANLQLSENAGAEDSISSGPIKTLEKYGRRYSPQYLTPYLAQYLANQQ